MCPKTDIPKRHVPNVPFYLRPSIDINQLLQQGFGLHQKGQFDEAQKIYEQILKINPKHFDALQLTAALFLLKKQFLEALRLFDSALVINPNYADAYVNRGNILKDLKRLDEALTSYDKAIQLNPNYAEVYSNRGNVLRDLERLDEALKSCDKAIQLKPDYADAYLNRGNALKDLKRLDEALKSYDKAIQLNPNYAEVYSNHGNVLRDLERLDEALKSYDKAIKLKPELDYILCDFIHTKMHLCDWVNYDQLIDQLINKTKNQKKVSSPFPVLALIDDPLTQKQSAEIYVDYKYRSSIALPKISKYPKPQKIRIGYFSADFHNHATMHLIAELFEHHNRTQFELYGFSFGSDSKDEWRKRAESSFDQFFDLSNKSDLEIALLARDLEIDIAVDLKGFTKDSKTQIFSYRAAPIQVNYLGYPGTMGAEYIDYIIADEVLIPRDKQQYYLEKVVYMPDSYQVNVKDRVVSNKLFTRQDMGLPDNAFVFCSFNNNYKITPDTFDCWMRILKLVENSVLWILKSNDTAVNNLKKEAERRGVDSKRLVFASMIPVEKHLKRIQLADLFLDTFPYNAHTTASDALRVGLPILTLMGESFASRVAASLLDAVGLSKLITKNRRDYESLAVELAIYPKKLQAIKNKLLVNVPTSSLFNSKLFTKNLESAYRTIYERYQNELTPDHIFISNQ